MNLNTTITNDSPLLFYVPQSLWYQAPPNDVLLSSYETQSYHATNGSQGQGSVSFSFTGTGIWLYGGYRTTLGAYTVVLDGEAFSQDGYHAGDPEQANYVLFGNNNLTSNQHTVQLINTSEDPARNVLDISQVIFEHSYDSAVAYQQINNTANQISYGCTNGGGWTHTPDFSTTQSSTGFFSLNFSGIGIAVYGLVSAAQAPYIVAVDNSPPVQLSPNTENMGSSASLLYLNNALSAGNHSIAIYNNPSASVNASTLGLCYVDVLAYLPNMQPHAPSPVDSPQTNISRVTAIVVASVVCSIFACVIIFSRWWWKMTKRKRTLYREVYAPRPFLSVSPAHMLLRRTPHLQAEPSLSGDQNIIFERDPTAALNPQQPVPAAPILPPRAAPTRRNRFSWRRSPPVMELPPPYDHTFFRL